MSVLATIPTRRQLEREALHDALLAADMREEAGAEVFGAQVRRVFRWANVFGFAGMPLICGCGYLLINSLWPVQ